MSYFVRDTVAVAAPAASASTIVTDYTKVFNGEICGIGWYATTPAFESTYTLTITAEDTSQAILNTVQVTTSLTWYYPRGQVHNTTGGGTSFGTTGLGLIRDKFLVANERIKVVVNGTSDITTGQGGTLVVVVKGSMGR